MIMGIMLSKIFSDRFLRMCSSILPPHTEQQSTSDKALSRARLMTRPRGSCFRLVPFFPALFMDSGSSTTWLTSLPGISEKIILSRRERDNKSLSEKYSCKKIYNYLTTLFSFSTNQKNHTPNHKYQPRSPSQ